jgi:uncharacterized membrane protein
MERFRLSFPGHLFDHPLHLPTDGQAGQRGLRALALLTVTCLSMTCVRGLLTGNWWFFVMLTWNLCLAWFPLGVMLVLRDVLRAQALPRWAIGAFLAVWVVFLPNAPYIITDLFHVRNLGDRLLGFDTLTLFLGALTGLLCGLYSILLAHRVLTAGLGRWGAWAVIAMVQPLMGFGIYLGRYVRLNSWHVVNHPYLLVRSIWQAMHEPLAVVTTLTYGFGLAVLYAAFYLYVQDDRRG